MNKKLTKWTGFHFSSGSYAGEDYLQFQRDMRTDLKCQAKENGLELQAFIKNHYAFSAVLKNTESNRLVYVNISDVRFWPDGWSERTLYRTMAHEKDWTGGGNHYCRWEDIGKCAAELVREKTS